MFIIKDLNLNINKYFLINSLLPILFIGLLIVLSSLKVIGYSITFLIIVPLLIYTSRDLYKFFITSSKINKISVVYIFYLILMSIIGSLNINDPRIIVFWPLLFATCIGSYLLHNKLLKENNFYSRNIDKIIYFFSLTYFFIYGLLNLISSFIYGNAYQIQDGSILSITGSSAAFHLSSIFLASLFTCWYNEKFKFFSHYLIGIIFFSFIVGVNNSRVGLLYLLLFLIFHIFTNLSRKNILNVILFPIIIYWVYFSGTFVARMEESMVDTLITISSRANNISKVISNDDNYKEYSGDDDRAFELVVGAKKFIRSPLINKLVGSGWYTARVNIVNTRNEMIDKYGARLKDFKSYKKSDVVQLQGIVAILIDTGIIGTFFTIFIYFLSAKLIYFSNIPFIIRLFSLLMLSLNCFCLFIGYPLANILFFLTYLPGGLLSNQNKKYI